MSCVVTKNCKKNAIELEGSYCLQMFGYFQEIVHTIVIVQVKTWQFVIGACYDFVEDGFELFEAFIDIQLDHIANDNTSDGISNIKILPENIVEEFVSLSDPKLMGHDKIIDRNFGYLRRHHELDAGPRHVGFFLMLHTNIWVPELILCHYCWPSICHPSSLIYYVDHSRW